MFLKNCIIQNEIIDKQNATEKSEQSWLVNKIFKDENNVSFVRER